MMTRTRIRSNPAVTLTPMQGPRDAEREIVIIIKILLTKLKITELHYFGIPFTNIVTVLVLEEIKVHEGTLTS